MRYKGILVLAAVMALSASKVASAQEGGAFWAISPKTLSQYLDEGWKIVGTDWETYSNADDYLYTLQKDEKAVRCLVTVRARAEPQVTCRYLN